MKSSLFGAVALAGLILFGLVSCSRDQPAANAQGGTAAQKWEYKVAYVEYWGIPEKNLGDPKSWENEAPKLAGKYNELGADGWEYVGVQRGQGVYAIFKRPMK